MKKHVLFRFLAVMVFAVFFIGAAFAQESKVVYYVYDAGRTDPATGASPELVVTSAIEEALGYEIVMFPTIMLENATEEQIEELRAADLIILGRAIGSWNWTADGRVIWNTIETPVLSTNAFAIRPNQLNWFFGSEQYGGEDGVELFGTVMYPDDPIFEGVELDDNNQFAIWTGGWTCIKVDPVFPGDGQILIQREVNEGAEIEVYLARFEAGKPFYEGGDTPAGPRTYMGLGADGDDNYRYWNYSDDGKTIFLREVERLANLESTTSVIETEHPVSATVYPNPATNNLYVRMNNIKKAEVFDITGKLVASIQGHGSELHIDMSSMHAGMYFVKAIDSNNHAVVMKVVKN